MAKKTSKKKGSAKRGGKKGTSKKPAKATKKKAAKQAKPVKKAKAKPAKAVAKAKPRAAKPAAKKPAPAKAPETAWSDDAGAAVLHEASAVEGGERTSSSVETSTDNHPRVSVESTGAEGGATDDDDFSMGQPLG